MSDDITIVSTTDSAEDVAAALTGKPAEKPAEPVVADKPAETPAAAAPAVPAAEPATPAEPVAPVAVAAPKADDEPPANETPLQRAERNAKSARERRMERIQGDIDGLVAQRGTARRDAEAEEAKLADLRRQAALLQADIDRAKTTPAPAAEPAAAKLATSTFTEPLPKLSDLKADGTAKYPEYEDWVADVARWSSDKATAEAAALVSAVETRLKKDVADGERTRTEQADAARAHQTAATAYGTRLAAFKAQTPDFDAVLNAAKEPVADLLEDLGPTALHVIDTFTVNDAEHGPALVHHLAQHPDEMRRIAALPLPQQLAALGRLDERLGPASTTAPARVPAPPVTRAPEPIKPVGGTPTASSVSPEDEDFRAYAARRNREERERVATAAR